MKRPTQILLTVDGIVNLVLGAALLLFPASSVTLLGLPQTNTYFYASILGAVLVGIGVALLVELFGAAGRIRGLGIGGAIAINVFGGGAVLAWLLAVPLPLPLRGKVVLWLIAVVVLGIALAELLSKSWKDQ